MVALLFSEGWEIVIGKGTTPPHWDNLTLEDEYDRMDASLTISKTFIDNDTLVLDCVFAPWGEVVEITEVAIVHKTPAWLLLREIVPTVHVPAGYGLPVTVKVPVTRE